MRLDRIATAISALGLGAVLIAPAGARAADDVTVVELTQVGCQFLEPEQGTDHGYTPKAAEDCERINARTGEERLAKAKVMELEPGKYVFRVTNKNVPYALGFWLREEDYDWKNPIHKVSKVSVSGGGLEPGTSKDYVVTLEPGEYLYSCPLNPTPDYLLRVKG